MRLSNKTIDSRDSTRGCFYDAVRVSGDDIIKVQRKRIEELQRELYKSQQQLQQIRQTQPATVRAEKLALQQHIHNKMQQQQQETATDPHIIIPKEL